MSWGAGLLGFLEEESPDLVIHGLKELIKIVPTDWSQIADGISIIEGLAARDEFRERSLAAYLASVLFYYMDDNDAAVRYALLSGAYFDPCRTDAHSQKMLVHAVKRHAAEMSEKLTPDKNLRVMIESAMEQLFAAGAKEQCLCLAIETRFRKFMDRVIGAEPGLVTAAVRIVNATVRDSEYRKELLSSFVKLSEQNCDQRTLSRVYYTLQDVRAISELLIMLMTSPEPNNCLMAYQIAFELAETTSQHFRAKVVEQLSDRGAVKRILSGKVSFELYHAFLFRNNNGNAMEIVNGLAKNVRLMSNVVHLSLVLLWTFAYSGSGNESFIRRENSLSFQRNQCRYNDFTITAARGAILRGRAGAGAAFTQRYLNGRADVHLLGGALYGLGLAFPNHACHASVIEILTELIYDKSSVVKQGGCLGLGLVAFGSNETLFYEQMLDVLNLDDAVSGEGAGYAIGLIMFGCGEGREVENLARSVENTAHDKIKRSGAMGLGFMMYKAEEQAEGLIGRLIVSRVALVRESAIWITAFAYVGTGSKVGLRRLLHFAVSDVNGDVRRAAVIGVGLILSKTPNEVLVMLDLLTKSCHASVRSGTALAIGFACAGTGMMNAVDILKPLLYDSDAFVTQNALIGMAMVLQQQSDVVVPYCEKFRMLLRSMTQKTTNEVISWGINLAYGILNASNRNVVLSCNTLSGETSALSVAAIAMFCNFIFWYPLTLMLTLAFHPTVIIGVNEDLEAPNWSFNLNGKPSHFADPPTFDAEVEVVSLAGARELSIRRSEVVPSACRAEEPPREDPIEADFQQLPNASRVTRQQVDLLDLTVDPSYSPLANDVRHGILLLKKTGAL